MLANGGPILEYCYGYSLFTMFYFGYFILRRTESHFYIRFLLELLLLFLRKGHIYSRKILQRKNKSFTFLSQTSPFIENINVLFKLN